MHSLHSVPPAPSTSTNPSSPLLSKLSTHRLPYLLLFFVLIFLLASSTIAYLLLSPSSVSSPLAHPTIILISFDGFRFGYQFKTPTPNIARLVSGGTSADLGLIPVFPTLTFPNHYSIVTGLYPPYHGIVSNSFIDPISGRPFTSHSHDPLFFLGEPIWATAANAGLPAAVYFWAGGEVPIANWTCPRSFCPPYNQSVPFDSRVDSVLSYFDLPPPQIPVVTALYFSDPDSQGHIFGPDHPEITAAVARLDALLGRLIRGLEDRNIFDQVHIILVGDHGMAGVCGGKYVFLEDLAPWIEIPAGWVQSQYQLLGIRPPAGVSAAAVVEKMNEGLASGKVENGERLRVYLKEELPERLHYSASERIWPIVGLVEEGYTVEVSRRQGTLCGGEHGYDNELFSMRSIFIGHGPRFEKGKKVESFVNVEIYNLMTSILGLEGAPNNGSNSFTTNVLLPDNS